MSFIYTIIKATRRYFNIYVALYCITVHCLFLCLTGNIINSIYEQSSLMVYANPVSFLSYSIGATFSCIVNSSGNMKCWGSNGEGQLGLGDILNRGDDPNEMGEDLPFVNLGVGQTIKSVFSGSTHGCAILSTDVAKCWGLNNNGQLGLGDVISRGTKVSDMGDTLQALNLGSLFTPAQIAIGSLHTCVLSLDKTVKCIGDGAFGALGYENTNDVGTTLSHLGDNLQLVPLGSGVKALSIHSFGEAFHNCILTTTQTVKCWGRNNNAQLGYGDILNRGASLNTMGSKLNEVDLGFVSTVKQVTVGAFHTCALRTDDKMKCWGLNSSAQLGIGLIGSLISLVGDLLGATLYDSTGKIAKQISAGRDHTCILLEDATSVKCIGDNSHGQLGLGDILTRGNTLLNTADKLLPINLGTGSLKLDSIIAGAQTTCAVFIDASIKCVGDGSNGALGLGLTADIGSLVSQLGSSLPFLNVFVTTKAPTTKAPTTKAPTTANPTNKPATATPTIKQLTNSPTISPVIACNYQNKKLCKQDSKCLWVRQKKVRLCVTFDCKKLKQGKCNKNKLKCIWDAQAMICNKKV